MARRARLGALAEISNSLIVWCLQVISGGKEISPPRRDFWHFSLSETQVYSLRLLMKEYSLILMEYLFGVGFESSGKNKHIPHNLRNYYCSPRLLIFKQIINSCRSTCYWDMLILQSYPENWPPGQPPRPPSPKIYPWTFLPQDNYPQAKYKRENYLGQWNSKTNSFMTIKWAWLSLLHDAQLSGFQIMQASEEAD